MMRRNFITYCGISIFILACGALASFYLPDIDEDYQHYRQLLNSAMSGILGLIAIITMFYSGKSHDYKKDFLKTRSKILMSHNLLIRRLEHMKTLSMESDKWSEINYKTLEHEKQLQKISQEHKHVTEEIFKISVPWRQYAFLTIPFAVLIVILYMFTCYDNSRLIWDREYRKLGRT